MTKKAVVFGGTGLIGNQLVLQLLDDPYYREVEIFVRRSTKISHEKLKEKIIPFNNLREELNCLEADVLFCCLGTTLKKAGSKERQRKIDCEIPSILANIAKSKNIEVYAFVSSLGATMDTSNFYLGLKGETERNIRDDYPDKYIIVRPSLLLGDRQEFRLGEKLAEVFMKLFSFLLIGKWRKYRPIQGKQVARKMIDFHKQERYGVFENNELN